MKRLALALPAGGFGVLLGYVVARNGVDGGDLLNFVGALAGAAVTVFGAMKLAQDERVREAVENRIFLENSLNALHITVSSVARFDSIAELDQSGAERARDELIGVHDRMEMAIELLSHAQQLTQLRDFKVLAALFRVRRQLDRDRALWANEGRIIRDNRITPRVVQVHLSKLYESSQLLARELENAIKALGGRVARPRIADMEIGAVAPQAGAATPR